jgi:hypothetical protein
MKEEDFEVKDRWMILTLIALGNPPKEIRVEVDPQTDQRILQFKFNACCKETYDRKMRGEKIPIDDIGKLEQAERIFKNNLYRLNQVLNNETRSGSHSK